MDKKKISIGIVVLIILIITISLIATSLRRLNSDESI